MSSGALCGAARDMFVFSLQGPSKEGERSTYGVPFAYRFKKTALLVNCNVLRTVRLHHVPTAQKKGVVTVPPFCMASFSYHTFLHPIALISYVDGALSHWRTFQEQASPSSLSPFLLCYQPFFDFLTSLPKVYVGLRYTHYSRNMECSVNASQHQ